MTQLPFQEEPQSIQDVRKGMSVVDAAGADLGTVELVRMGDPQAVTGAGQEFPGDPLATVVQAAFGSSRLPQPVAERYLRTGYLKIERGLLTRDEYVGADQVEAVRGDVVHLRITKDRLSEPR